MKRRDARLQGYSEKYANFLSDVKFAVKVQALLDSRSGTLSIGLSGSQTELANKYLGMDFSRHFRWGLLFLMFLLFARTERLQSTRLWIFIIKVMRLQLPLKVFVKSDFIRSLFEIGVIFRQIGVTTATIQHGLFPYRNKGDLDGISLDEVVVWTPSQQRILRRAGFEGVIKCLDLGKQGSVITGGKQQVEVDKNTRIIFVGPGFEHDSTLENAIYNVVETLVATYPDKVRYKPHPRCSEWIRERINAVCPLLYPTEAELSPDHIYVGVKSTLLFESQLAGIPTVLLENDHFPKYFEDGEILRTVNSVKQLVIVLNELGVECAFKRHVNWG